MKKINIITLVLLSIICIGCMRTKPCPSCLSDLNYFPYEKGQYLKFINLQSDTLVYIITYKEIYDDDFATKGGIYNKGNFCVSYINIYIESLKDVKKIGCGVSVSGSLEEVWNVDAGIRFSIENDTSDFLTKELITNNCSYKKVNKYLNDIIIMKNNNNKLVKKVVIVKNKGLVSYTTADGEEWKLAE